MKTVILRDEWSWLSTKWFNCLLEILFHYWNAHLGFFFCNWAILLFLSALFLVLWVMNMLLFVIVKLGSCYEGYILWSLVVFYSQLLKCLKLCFSVDIYWGSSFATEIYLYFLSVYFLCYYWRTCCWFLIWLLTWLVVLILSYLAYCGFYGCW